MPQKRIQNLAETDKGSYHKVERLEEFCDSKGAFYNDNDSDNDNDNYNENNTAVVTGRFCQSLLQNTFTTSSTKTNCRFSHLQAPEAL